MYCQTKNKTLENNQSAVLDILQEGEPLQKDNQTKRRLSYPIPSEQLALP